MKNINSVFTMAAIVALISTATLQAQRYQGQMRDGKSYVHQSEQCVLDLSDEQQTKIDALRITNMEKMQALRLDVKELKVQLERLETAKNPNQKNIDAKIDELFLAKAKIAKQRSAHHQDIRALLTDEQRILFDTRRPRNGKQGKGHGYRAIAYK